MKHFSFLRKSILIPLSFAVVLTLLMGMLTYAGFITDGTSNTFTGGVFVGIGDGSVRRSGFDPILIVSDNGRRISVTGTVSCTEGEEVKVHTILSQRVTGAVAEGNWKGQCVGDFQAWQTEAIVRGNSRFTPGTALGSTLGVTSVKGKNTDALQWIDEVTLVQY